MFRDGWLVSVLPHCFASTVQKPRKTNELWTKNNFSRAATNWHFQGGRQIDFNLLLYLTINWISGRANARLSPPWLRAWALAELHIFVIQACDSCQESPNLMFVRTWTVKFTTFIGQKCSTFPNVLNWMRNVFAFFHGVMSNSKHYQHVFFKVKPFHVHVCKTSLSLTRSLSGMIRH